MYYINPTNNPSNIHRWYLSKSIDICQLLLVTEGAFGKSLYEFEYKAEETKIEIGSYIHDYIRLSGEKEEKIKKDDEDNFKLINK